MVWRLVLPAESDTARGGKTPRRLSQRPEESQTGCASHLEDLVTMLGIITITGKGEPGLPCSPEAVAGGVNAVFPPTCIWVGTSRSVAGHTDGRVILSVRWLLIR